MKKVTLVLVVVLLLIGNTGCRLPLIDPPIIGRWLAEEDDVKIYFDFNRDKTGKIEFVFDEDSFGFKSDGLPSIFLEIGGDATEPKQSGISREITWTYQRSSHILVIYLRGDRLELKVEYNNLFRTKATMYPPDDPQDKLDFILVSTPIFRL